MNRMDVKRKVQLMRVYESYWDMLPPELQTYVIELKLAQVYPDKIRDYHKWRLLREIKEYINVKEKWGLGHIRCVPKIKVCFACGYHHVKVFASYVNELGLKKTFFLGNGYANALASVNFVKSDL